MRARFWFSVIVTVATLVTAWFSAHAVVKLPNGKVIPDPMVSCCSGKTCGLAAIFACSCTKVGICNIGKPCPGSGPKTCDEGKNGTCESRIWHKFNGDVCIPENMTGLHPQQDAAVNPETFQPACGLTFQLLTGGSSMFKTSFGWYNVPAGGGKPAAADLYSLVDCNTSAGKAIAFDLLKDTNYKGGDIGFYLVTPESHTTAGTCAGGDCCATVARALKGEGYIYYSQSKHNPDNDGSGKYIHLLLYASKIFSHTFYFTWEDTYKGSSTDYSDFVTRVSGISCAGAGVQCDTKKSGICGLGVTKCDKDGKLVCEAAYSSKAEKCDGLDNDCNGKVDDGATCPQGKVCHRGTCRPKCTGSKVMPCQVGYVCDKASGLCLDKSCKGVTCKTGEICVKGKCGSGCEGVVCPRGQICRAAACIDPCAGLTCGSGKICKGGLCLADCSMCGGVTCKPGWLCDTKSGDCYSSACKPKCKSGTYCVGVKCVDLCHGVKCPGGLKCINGSCPPLGIGKTGPSFDGSVPPGDSGADASVPDAVPRDIIAPGDLGPEQDAGKKGRACIIIGREGECAGDAGCSAVPSVATDRSSPLLLQWLFLVLVLARARKQRR